MSVTLDPKATADRIKSFLDKEPFPEPSAEERHSLSFLQQVCGFLGVGASDINIAHVSHLMGKAEIAQHKPDEYPKMLSVKDKRGRTIAAAYPEDHELAGQPIVFHSKEEEDTYNATDKAA